MEQRVKVLEKREGRFEEHTRLLLDNVLKPWFHNLSPEKTTESYTYDTKIGRAIYHRDGKSTHKVKGKDAINESRATIGFPQNKFGWELRCGISHLKAYGFAWNAYLEIVSTTEELLGQIVVAWKRIEEKILNDLRHNCPTLSSPEQDFPQEGDYYYLEVAVFYIWEQLRTHYLNGRESLAPLTLSSVNFRQGPICTVIAEGWKHPTLAFCKEKQIAERFRETVQKIFRDEGLFTATSETLRLENVINYQTTQVEQEIARIGFYFEESHVNLNGKCNICERW